MSNYLNYQFQISEGQGIKRIECDIMRGVGSHPYGGRDGYGFHAADVVGVGPLRQDRCLPGWGSPLGDYHSDIIVSHRTANSK